MGQVQKTVFISYRRTNVPWALAISQCLTHNGYDVFFDFTGIASGDFERVILESIKARAHFLVLLAPSALERVNEPGDLLRREIEFAMDERRNIVPLFLEGFDFGAPAIARQLTGRLADLSRYNGLSVPAEYFDAAMDKLQSRYLNVSLDAVLHPASARAVEAAKVERNAAEAAPRVEARELTASEWFEKGFEAVDPGEKLRCFSEAIRLKPDYALAYYNRAISRAERGDLDGAIADYDEAIRLTPDDADAYNNRGNLRRDKGDLDGARADFDAAVRLKPDDADAYSNRGNARADKGDLDGALADYDEAIRLKPDDPEVYCNRGNTRGDRGDLHGAIADYDEAIRLKPDYPDAYFNRAETRGDNADLGGALADYDEAIRRKPDYADAYCNRGSIRRESGDLGGALADYNEAIRLNPNDADSFYNRALVLASRRSYRAAIADYEQYLRLGGGRRDGDQAEVEGTIRELKAKMRRPPARRKGRSRR